ncbi:hypothetical protein [Ruminococcus sp.]|nr:hypothetical protein [Ruminococcus sp.]
MIKILWISQAMRKIVLLLEQLEDSDDVQNVYHNWNMPEED